ncbi:MAG: type II secretion system minor pseudopilin GspJ [Colwellia sp.]|nr:type II secretion system minor pseudopilin GspJ [Colwellia sp.]
MVMQKSFSYSHLHKSNGFTLLEVLIAIVIFAIISLTSFSIFNTVIKSDESSRIHSKRINELQRAFLIIERDLLQISKRTIRLNGEAPLEGFLHTDNSFSSSAQYLGFVRQGWTNPGLLLPRSDMQSVAYQLSDDTLERLHFNFVDPVQGEEPRVRKLISKVTSLKFEYFDGKKWQKEHKNNELPFAIAIEIETEDYGVIRRQFLVAGDASTSSKNSLSGGN